jgi:hypothetical protein
MGYAQSMEKGFPRLDRAHTVSKGRLVETTPEVNRKVAESAMRLSQSARRTIQTRNDARNGNAEPAAASAAAADQATRA